MGDFINNIFSNTAFRLILALIMLLASAILYEIAKVISAKAKIANIDVSTNDSMASISLIRDIIYTCVKSTNQTLVNRLKAEGKFTTEKQEEAFDQTFNLVMDLVGDIARKLVPNEDEEVAANYIKAMIETTVSEQKDNSHSENGCPDYNDGDCGDIGISVNIEDLLNSVDQNSIWETNEKPATEPSIDETNADIYFGE